MGTRADFYVGRGEHAEWIGSIAWDGYPAGITPRNGAWRAKCHLFDAKTEATFRKRVDEFFAGREDVTRPNQGWPWPWEDSRTTDYSYAFDAGAVWATNWGYVWWKASKPEPEDDGDEREKVAVFPNMKDKQRVTLGKRSGVIVVGG